jgi:O-antigen ligase
MRFILPDFLAIALVAAFALEGPGLIRQLSRSSAVAAAGVAATLFFVVSVSATAISLVFITPVNFQQWIGHDNLIAWNGSPLARSVVENVRLLQCISALIVTLAVVNTPQRLLAATRWFVMGATIAALYGCYVWVVMVTDVGLPLLPGTFSYVHLKRTAATFPEPAAYAGFALTGLALTAWMLERRSEGRWLLAALAVQLFAAVTSLSTLVVAGLALIWITTLLGFHRTTLLTLTLSGATALLVVLAVVPNASVFRAVEKPFTTHASWLDRTTAWRTALAMATEYPVLGVGAGLYAYNQAPFIPPDSSIRYAGGRVNSPALEIAAESGLLGVVVFGILVCAAGLGAARANHGYAGLRGLAVLVVLMAGYYTSRYSFLWVFAGLLICGTVRRYEDRPDSILTNPKMRLRSGVGTDLSCVS